MRSRHLARPRDSLTLALATTCSQSPSPCAITIANTANTATTPPHHHTRCAPSILTTAVAPRRSSNHRFAYPTSVFARLANPVCSTSKNTFMASHDSPSDDTAVTQNDRIKFRFCRECSNMLYPREDKETNQLIFQCRNCQWPTAVGPTCIYRNEVSHNLRETAGVVTDVASDPTLPHVERDCENPRCGGRDAVFFQSQQRNSETGMKLFYVCCECGKTST
ncbi:hypothetical protein D6D28_02982 [Aureobasidium pullulans]|uniref:DNA-directed RNA polymerase II subunit RPB9 n=1 Tax=Aureobasidium pullulans TaxID=5580 RepID=A0A4S8SS08_AURPU|nr:hypothetical protein D6D28_02982 [Aureobasidium pullulans]